MPLRIDARNVERVYNESIIADGGIEPAVARLSAAARDVSKTMRYRANAYLLKSHLQWRHGQIGPALESVEQGLAIDPYDDMVFHKARIIDATGKSDARVWYEKALALTTNSALKETIRVRLTLIDAVDQQVRGLVELAMTRPRDFRNRAAIALGVLDFNKEAIDLYQISGEGSERFRQHSRVAQWAIKAGDPARAQEEAWHAVQAATLEHDRRYALSLLAEAHRLDNSIDRLLDRLSRQPSLTREAQDFRIELLRQTGQYRKAIDLFTASNKGELSPQQRLELLGLYRDAGEDSAMVAEYRRLIENEPASIDWPVGLSRHFLESGDQSAAIKTWSEFLARNQSVNTLLEASESIASLGLQDLAMNALEKALAQEPDIALETRVRLTQFEQYLRRNMNSAAERALAALDSRLSGDSAFRTELAEAYERLHKPEMAIRTLQAFAALKGGLSVDERMRLAWMLDSVGRRDDALNVWRELWATETLASRRRLIEDRLLLLAAELGKLGDLAVELEEKLRAGKATPQEVALLVSLYTKVGDSVSAIEVLTTGASRSPKDRASEIANLKEQARIYLSLFEYADFARVTRRLLEIDPANKIEYLQSLLLNQIEAGSESHGPNAEGAANLTRWLDQLRQVGGGAVGTEFEAGVFDLAGFRDKAIDSYRRALALSPDRADDHLQLADLLRQAGRQTEAVAYLQYVAETAESDELFLIAIDGITNMRTGNVATLRWAERLALERLTRRDDKLYLYEMLADLAEEIKDIKVYRSALENSLAHADSRRSYVLRELIAATADVTTYEASQRVNGPDPKLNIAYGRRLISLGEELPPDVYIDLGRTFIRMNEPASAMRAFTLAIDRTGRASIMFEAAKLFERGGFGREATRQFERTLIADQANVEAIFRLARLLERSRLFSSANDLYLRALTTLAMEQAGHLPGAPAAAATGDAALSFNYRQYYEVVLTGFLMTLPEPGPDREARLGALERAFSEELREVAAGGSESTALVRDYPRLSVFARIVRTAAFSIGSVDLASHVERDLARQFPGDESVAANAAADRIQWGFAMPPADTAGPKDASAYIRDIGLAMVRGDQDAALAIYREWVRVGGLPKPPIRLGTNEYADRTPGLPEIATHARYRLDARHFGSLAQYIQTLLAEQDAYAEKLLLNLIFSYDIVDVPILTYLERTVGQPLIPEDRIMRIVGKSTNWSQLNVDYVLAHVSPARQVDILVRYVSMLDVSWPYFFRGLASALSKPLSASEQARLVASLKPAIQASLKKANAATLLPYFMNYEFTAGILPQNAIVIEQIEQFIADIHPQFFKVGYFRANLLRNIGRDLEALSAFVDVALQMYSPPMPAGAATPQTGQPTSAAYQGYIRNFARFVFPRYKTEVRRLLDEREAAGMTDALVSLETELNANDPASDPREFIARLQAKSDRHPENELLLNALASLYEQRGDSAGFVTTLGHLVRVHPDSRVYRYRLASAWQKMDRPEKSAEVVGTSTLADLAPVVPRNYYQEYNAGSVLTRFVVLKRSMDQIKAAKVGGDQAEAASGLRTLLQNLQPPRTSANEYTMNRDPADPSLSIRDLMTADVETSPKPDGAVAESSNTYDRLIDSLTVGVSSAPRPEKVLDAVVKYPFAASELEAFLNAQRAEDIDAQHVFYLQLIEAYTIDGHAQAELDRRTPTIQSGMAGLKGTTIWLGLAATQPAAKATDLLHIAETAGVPARTSSWLSRLLLARLYSKAGRRDAALELYTAVANAVLAGTANTIQPNTFVLDTFGRDRGLTLFTGVGLFDEVQRNLDAEGLAQFTDSLLILARPPANPIAEQIYARFVTLLYVCAARDGVAIRSLRDAVAALTINPIWPRAEILQATFAKAHSGQTDDAIAALQSALRRDVDTREPPSAFSLEAVYGWRRYELALGLTGEPQWLSPFGASASGIEEFKPLFPGADGAWSDAATWASRVAAMLPDAVGAGRVNRDAGTQLLAFLVLRLDEFPDLPARDLALRALSNAVRAGNLSTRTTTLAVAVADRVGSPIDLDAAQAAALANRLDAKRTIAVIQRTAQSGDASRALELGAAAAEFCSSDELTNALIKIATAAGRAADADQWATRQGDAAAARAKLANKR